MKSSRLILPQFVFLLQENAKGLAPLFRFICHAGMRVGGFRRLLVPPQLGYGDKQVSDEIPPNSTLLVDLELLSIKPKTPFGTQVKLVEG